jgi:hypothetical protein
VLNLNEVGRLAGVGTAAGHEHGGDTEVAAVVHFDSVIALAVNYGL